MTSLLIKDLSLALPLDREAACAVHGGTTAFPVEPDNGTGGAPVGRMPLPWPLPAMPDFPMLPVFGWCGTPHGPRVPHSTPTDPAAIR